MNKSINPSYQSINKLTTLMMASAQVVETSVNTNNSPSQDYTTNPDDYSNHNTNQSINQSINQSRNQ